MVPVVSLIVGYQVEIFIHENMSVLLGMPFNEYLYLDALVV